MLASHLRFWEASQRKGYTKAAKSSGGATGPSKHKAAKLLGTPNDRMTGWQVGVGVGLDYTPETHMSPENWYLEY